MNNHSGVLVQYTHPVGDLVRELFSNSIVSFLINTVIGILAIIAFVNLSGLILIWLERKVSAHFQARLGPMRVGWHGTLQTIADMIKLLLKESILPARADRFTYFLAPLLPITGSFLILIVIPFDYNLQMIDIKLGVPYVIAISGIGVFGILLAGWSSNNKYSLFGAMRTVAQMLSYEISISLTLLLIVLISGTTSLREIVFSQEGTIFNWWLIRAFPVGIIGFILYLVASTAELNRGPFDIAEAESELTAGFHTEYSGMTFALFFLAEFTNMVISASLATTFFLGGFWAPKLGFSSIDQFLILIPGWMWFLLKTYLIIFLYMWFRWTFPRLRIDQLMVLEWKILLPTSLANLLVAAVLVAMGLFV